MRPPSSRLALALALAVVVAACTADDPPATLATADAAPLARLTSAQYKVVTEADGTPLSAMPVRELAGIDGTNIDCTGLIDELLS